MKLITDSSAWFERYRPKCVEDYIATDEIKKLIAKIKTKGETQNLLLYSRSAGTGKTSLGHIIAAELGADLLYINGSKDTSIDTVRYDVTQFTMTHSLMGGKKIVILDECERISSNGQEALKVLMEQCEANARFILCTNNMQKIVPPVISRCQTISFEHSAKDREALMLQYFKRCCFILDREKVKYDKQVLAQVVYKMYPDLRKIIGELQRYSDAHGVIDAKILGAMEDSQVGNLISEMKARKFSNIRNLCSQIDPSQFYTEFYKQISEHLNPQCIPDVIITLARYAYQHASSVDVEINLVACVVELTQQANWK